MAVSAQLLATLNNLAASVKAAREAWEDETNKLGQLIQLDQEYERQIAYHAGRGDDENANIVGTTLLAPLHVLEDKQRVVIAEKLKDYQAAQGSYNEAVKNLTPDQQKAIETQNHIDAAEADAGKAKAEKELLAQGTTKYLIVAAVVLTVVVIVGLFFYKRGG